MFFFFFKKSTWKTRFGCKTSGWGWRYQNSIYFRKIHKKQNHICYQWSDRERMSKWNVVYLMISTINWTILKKRALLKKYTESEEISEENAIKILENEIYFPLLCKLFASNRKHFKDVLQFFMEPIDILKDELEICKISDKEKYCSLVCLVLFNNKLVQNDLYKKNKIFKKCLHLCGIQEHLPPVTIMRNLELLEGLFTKKCMITINFITTLSWT